MKRGRPITPEELPEKKRKVIPEFVFDAFNDTLIEAVENASDSDDKKRTLKVLQKDVKKRINELNTEELNFEFYWLDVEPYYEEAGWKVEYDKPAFCEYYDPVFYFTPK